MATEAEAFEALDTEELAADIKRLEVCKEFAGYGFQLTDKGAVVTIFVNRQMEDLSDKFRDLAPDHIRLPSGIQVPVKFFPEP